MNDKSGTPKLIVLDLDETLVFASEAALDRPPDFETCGYHVYVRPHLAQFIRFCFDRFRVAVWTSSGSIYAQEIVRHIIPIPEALEFLWSSERCTRRIDQDEGHWLSNKNLRKVRRRGYPLEHVLVVDDSPEKHRRNYGNLLRVREYNGSAEDDELLCLMRYLELLEHVPNIRAVEKRGWHQQVNCCEADPFPTSRDQPIRRSR